MMDSQIRAALPQAHYASILQHYRDMALMALDRFSNAILFIDASRKLLYKNRAAHAIFDRSDGLLVEKSAMQPATLGCFDMADQRQLMHSLRILFTGAASGTAAASQVVKIRRSTATPPYLLHLSCLTSATIDVGPSCAMVVVVDPAAGNSLDPSQLSMLYGLTPTEARIAVAYASTKSIDMIATSFSISRNTVKAHLKHAFSKIGIDNRADLTRLLQALGNFSVESTGNFNQ